MAGAILDRTKKENEVYLEFCGGLMANGGPMLNSLTALLRREIEVKS
jgi:hypothetical protein